MNVLVCLLFPAAPAPISRGYRIIECVRVRIQTRVCLAITPFLLQGILLLTEGAQLARLRSSLHFRARRSCAALR